MRNAASAQAGEGWTGQKHKLQPRHGSGEPKAFWQGAPPREPKGRAGKLLAAQLPRQQSKRYSHCLRSRVPSLVFVCVCVYFSEFLSLHPRELAGCKLQPSHGIRINSWILAAPGGEQLLLNRSPAKVPQATRQPKSKCCLLPICQETPNPPD